MCVVEGLDFGERRQNGRPFGRLDRCWSFPAGGDRGAQRAAAADEGRAGADRRGKHDAGVKVADVARKHGTTRWQIYDWRKQIRKGNLVLPEAVASLPIFAELVVDDSAVHAPAVRGASGLEIVVGDVVIRAGADADEGQLTRAIRAARAAAS